LSAAMVGNSEEKMMNKAVEVTAYSRLIIF